MLTARRISQVLFLLFFLYLFFQAAFPYDKWLPSDLFLRSSPLVAIATFLTTKKFIGTFVIAIIILVLSTALGRYFCGWLCPLGTTIDFSDWLSRKFRKNKPNPTRKLRSWKFSILIIVLIAALFSVQLIWFFDPIVIMTRTVTTSIYPLFAFLLESSMNLLLGIDIFQNTLFSIYDFLRKTVLPLEQLFFQQSLLFAVILIGIMLFSLISRRFWCRYFCPLGALFGFFSSFRLTRGIFVASDKCIDCGKCQRECKMDAINDDYRSHSRIECIECMSCVAVCPTDAISYKLSFKFTPQKFDVSRRRFVYSSVGSIVTLGLIKTGFHNTLTAGLVVRPPGALLETEFLDRCVRCQECVKICSSTGGCLQPSMLESGWEGIWSPIVNARHGYCEYNCNLCGQVCPSQAIHPLDLDTKKRVRMGMAYFDKNRCIPWYRGEDCLVCEEHCPLPEKAIKFDIREARRPDGTMRIVKFPYVDESLCIGCGICVTKCPVEGPGGLFLTNAMQQRWEEGLIF
jgi:polyferredoxin